MSIAFESFTRYPEDYGLTRDEGYTLNAAMLGISHGVNTGRISGTSAIWWRDLNNAGKVDAIYAIIKKAGYMGSVDDYYSAFRDIAMEKSGAIRGNPGRRRRRANKRYRKSARRRGRRNPSDAFTEKTIASLERTLAREGRQAAYHRATSMLASAVLSRPFGAAYEETEHHKAIREWARKHK